MNVLLKSLQGNLQQDIDDIINKIEPIVPTGFTGADWQAMVQKAILIAVD